MIVGKDPIVSCLRCPMELLYRDHMFNARQTHQMKVAKNSGHLSLLEGSIGNCKNIPKKSTNLGRIMGFWQYMVCPWCEPWSLQPACIKFSNFMPILDAAMVKTPSLIIFGLHIGSKQSFLLGFSLFSTGLT